MGFHKDRRCEGAWRDFLESVGAHPDMDDTDPNYDLLRFDYTCKYGPQFDSVADIEQYLLEALGEFACEFDTERAARELRDDMPYNAGVSRWVLTDYVQEKLWDRIPHYAYTIM